MVEFSINRSLLLLLLLSFVWLFIKEFFLWQCIKRRLHINACSYKQKHGSQGGSTPVGLQWRHSHMHTCRSASEAVVWALLCTRLLSHACTYHLLLSQRCACHALLLVDGEFSRRHTKTSLPPPTPSSSSSSLTFPPLSSTVVIEDENGDEALKNGTEKTSGEA